ncbi:hypothetical protein DL768_002122 [Monosporascus sp. mg162]|nr:hypothetical protein DL768_002122 [Monosporascus sp. mg162]
MEEILVHKGSSSESAHLLRLANDILNDTTRIIRYLNTHERLTQSFARNSTERLETDEYNSVRNSLIANLEDLKYLIEGPRNAMRTFLRLGNDLAALQVAFEFELFRLIPRDGDMDVAQLALEAGMDEDRACRVLRMLATHRIFIETTPRSFAHTPSSILFHDDEELMCTGQYIMDEFFKAASESASCIRAAPQVSSSVHSPFATRHGVPLFKYYEQHPDRAARFAKAMAGWTKLDRQVDVKGGFPWGNLQGTVLDVGGGSGHVSMALAQEFPQLNFIVQDGSAEMLAEGTMLKKTLPGEVSRRVSFMRHDFFESQTVRNVSAVLVRQVTHNWTGEDVVRILRAIIPTLEGSKRPTPLLINDTVMPEPRELPLHEERVYRNLDMMMFVCLGSKQRTRSEFAALLEKADERFSICNVYTDGNMSMLEIYLQS